MRLRLEYVAPLALYLFVFSAFSVADVRVEGSQVGGLEVDVFVSPGEDSREKATLEACRRAFSALLDYRHCVDGKEAPPFPSDKELLDMLESISVLNHKETPFKHQFVFDINFKKEGLDKWISEKKPPPQKSLKPESLEQAPASFPEKPPSPRINFSSPQTEEIRKSLKMIIRHHQDWVELKSVLDAFPRIKWLGENLSQKKGEIWIMWKEGEGKGDERGGDEELEAALRTRGFSVTKDEKDKGVWSLEKKSSRPVLNLRRLPEKQ